MSLQIYEEEASRCSCFGDSRTSPPDFDLKQWYTDLYSEQIAGYYDDEIKTMFVVQDTGFGGYEKLTYAHEYTHVLQDQVYGFDDILDMSEEACQADSENVPPSRP